MLKRRTRFAIVLAAFAAFVIAAQPAFAATAKFGAKLSNGVFPSNAYPGTYCDHELYGGNNTYACTWIMLTAFNGGSPTAPKDGTINKVKIINGQGGSFKIVVARKSQTTQFKVVGRSTKISYATDKCEPDCTVHKYSFPGLKVKAGDYIGIQAAKTSTLRCDSGGNKIALFTPKLPVGGSYTTPSGYSGCYLLIQVVYAS